MVYCLDLKLYPIKNQFIEEIKYKDENDLEWRIARVQNGFFVRYFGHDYFCENSFDCQIDSGKTIRVKNTNCIFFQDANFETFCEMRNILKTGWTDDIWESIQDFLTIRLQQSTGLIESEII